MKYKDIESLLSGKRGRVSLVSISDPSERASVLRKLTPADAHVEVFSPDVELSVLFDALLSPSLFGGQTAVIVDDVDLIKKKDAEKIGAFLEKNILSCSLILGAKGKTPLSSIVEKIGAYLDMSVEKPWDRDKRLKQSLILEAKKEGKYLSGDAAQLILEKIGPNFYLLMSEVFKLSCFVGDRPNIERTDVFRMTGTNSNETLWKTAEEIVWEGGGGSFDPTAFIGLIFSLRAQLQIGAKMADLIKANVPFSEWSPLFPKVWPKTLEKRRGQAVKKGPEFFKKGLEVLYKVEMLSRTGARPQDLFDLFRTTLKSYG